MIEYVLQSLDVSSQELHYSLVVQAQFNPFLPLQKLVGPVHDPKLPFSKNTPFTAVFYTFPVICDYSS